MGKSRFLNLSSILLLDYLILLVKSLVLKYCLDDPNCVDKELPTSQLLNMFVSACAQLECRFFCVHVCPAPFGVCGSMWSHKAQEMLLNPCHKPAEVTSQSALLIRPVQVWMGVHICSILPRHRLHYPFLCFIVFPNSFWLHCFSIMKRNNFQSCPQRPRVTCRYITPLYFSLSAFSKGIVDLINKTEEC